MNTFRDLLAAKGIYYIDGKFTDGSRPIHKKQSGIQCEVVFYAQDKISKYSTDLLEKYRLRIRKHLGIGLTTRTILQQEALEALNNLKLFSHSQHVRSSYLKAYKDCHRKITFKNVFMGIPYEDNKKSGDKND